MTLVTAGLLRPRALLPTRGLGRFASAARPDTHDGFGHYPQEVIDAYRKAKRKEYASREELVNDMRSMLEDAVTSKIPEIAAEAATIERRLISRKGVEKDGRTYIMPVVDYAAILKDINAMLQLMALYMEIRRREEEAILVLLLDS